MLASFKATIKLEKVRKVERIVLILLFNSLQLL